MSHRQCKACGCDISSRHFLAKRCFPCAAMWGHKSGAIAATAEVAHAIRRGELPKVSTLSCVDCGKPATDYDHRDYNKPLDVQPVCRSCNKLRGPAIHVEVA